MDSRSASPLEPKQCNLTEENDNCTSQTCDLSQHDSRLPFRNAADCNINEQITQKASTSSSGSISDLECKDEEDSSYNASSLEDVDETSDEAIVDDDCVIIKVIQKAKQKNSVNAVDQKSVKDALPIYCDIVNPDLKVPKKNKTYNFPLPRRNPKRLAKQLNCRKLKLESRFYYTYPPTKQAKKTISDKLLGSNIQRTNRTAKRPQKFDDDVYENLSSQSDISKDVSNIVPKKKMRTKSRTIDASEYEPPSPEAQWIWREWPTEGMHERPVWPDPRYETENCSPMQEIAHHALHAVLGFCAYVCSKTNIPAASKTPSNNDSLLKFYSDTGNSNEANAASENGKQDYSYLEPQIEHKNTESHNPSNSYSENADNLLNCTTENIGSLIIEESSMISNKEVHENIYDLSALSSSETFLSNVNDLCYKKLATEMNIPPNCFEKQDKLGIEENKEISSNIHKSVDSFIGKTDKNIKLDQGVSDSESKNDIGEVISFEGLRDLVNYTALLYCIVCSVPQDNVANYINSMDASKAMEWLEEIL